MKLEVFIPFVTYPESNSDAFAAHAASLAAQIDARLHAVAINADIPDVSNTLSKWLLDTPALIQQAESASRQRGEHLLALLNKEADDEGVEIRTAAVAPPIAMLGDVAASRARYYLLHMARREDKVLTTLALVHAGWPDVVESRLPGIHDRSGDLAMNGIR